MQRFSREPVRHFNTERRRRTFVVGLSGKETECLFDKGKETLFGGKIACITRHCRPIERSGIYGVVSWTALHKGKSRTNIVFYLFEFFFVIAPRQHVEVCFDGSQTLRMCHVQILFYPLPIDLVGTRISCQRKHIASLLLEVSQVFIAIPDKQILIVDMVARK